MKLIITRRSLWRGSRPDPHRRWISVWLTSPVKGKPKKRSERSTLERLSICATPPVMPYPGGVQEKSAT